MVGSPFGAQDNEEIRSSDISEMNCLASISKSERIETEEYLIQKLK